MDDVALLLAGVIAGAVATGVAQLLIAWRQRQLGRMVAARLVLGGLVVTHEMIRMIEASRRWPDRSGFDAPLRDWLEARERFIVAVTPAEWLLTHSLFDDLHRTAKMDRPGETCTDRELEVLAGVRARLPKVVEIVGAHAVPRREQSDLQRGIHAVLDKSQGNAGR